MSTGVVSGVNRERIIPEAGAEPRGFLEEAAHGGPSLLVPVSEHGLALVTLGRFVTDSL